MRLNTYFVGIASDLSAEVKDYIAIKFAAIVSFTNFAGKILAAVINVSNFENKNYHFCFCCYYFNSVGIFC